MALVTQDVQLFQATVRDNITFFDRSIPDEQILAVFHELGWTTGCRRCQRAWIPSSKPGGAASPPGRRSCWPLRASFLRNPGLVILDEASSRLDPATEQLIERAIDKLLKNRTAIIIAHRLGTIHRTDEIMILEDGRDHRVRQPPAPGSRPGHPLSRPAAYRAGGGAGMSTSIADTAKTPETKRTLPAWKVILEDDPLPPRSLAGELAGDDVRHAVLPDPRAGPARVFQLL